MGRVHAALIRLVEMLPRPVQTCIVMSMWVPLGLGYWAWCWINWRIISPVMCLFGRHAFTDHSYSAPETDHPHHWRRCGSCGKKVDCGPECDWGRPIEFPDGSTRKMVWATSDDGNPFERVKIEPEITIESTRHDGDRDV